MKKSRQASLWKIAASWWFDLPFYPMNNETKKKLREAILRGNDVANDSSTLLILYLE
jgi:hypothetical protein